MGGPAAPHPADLRGVYLRGGNHTVKTGHAGFATSVPPHCEPEIRRAHSGPSPGSEIPHPVPSFQS